MTDDQAKTDMTIALMQGIDSLSPIFDAAEGIRADLARRDWSPTAAETVSLEWLLGAMRLVWQKQP